MPLYLYDSLSRSTREFIPQESGIASIYVCGPTVQAVPHIGHIRSGVVFDILRRWLIWHGYDVLLIRNVTDIDDKILHKAQEAGRPWWEWAQINDNAFRQAYTELGVLPPSAEPHATGYIPQIVEYIEGLINKGYAYISEGDVYFSVSSFSEYGELSRQKMTDMLQGETLTRGKRDPHDFTLWKAAKPSEPYWNTPWGPGRPGWHIECSAMAVNLLGSQFDIHGGGIDLIFPHHENEIAQSRALGDNFANYWLHNGWITMSGEKMSKSLGNVVSIPNLLTQVRGIELRYYMSITHYRSHQEFSFQALQEAATAFRRIETFLHKIEKLYGPLTLGAPTEGFIDAMNKDLLVPEALAHIYATINAGNTELSQANPSSEIVVPLAENIRAMLDILGCDPLNPAWENHTADNDSHAALDTLVHYILDQRQLARAERNFSKADEIRDVLLKAGIEIHDGQESSQWQLKRQ